MRVHRIQPNSETRKKQLDAWRTLLLDYCRTQKVCIIDVREGDCLPVFNNAAISSKFINYFMFNFKYTLTRCNNIYLVVLTKSNFKATQSNDKLVNLELIYSLEVLKIVILH